MNQVMHDEQVDTYDALLDRARYYMKLQEGCGEPSFRLRLKALFPLLGIHSAAQFNKVVDGEVADDYYLMPDKKTKAHDRPSRRTLKKICLACRVPMLITLELFQLAGCSLNRADFDDRAFLAVISSRPWCNLATKLKLIEDLKAL